MQFTRTVWLFLVFGASLLALLLACLGIETSKTNLLGWFLALVGVGYLVGMVIYLMRHSTGVKVTREEKSDLSFWLILPGFLVAFFGSPLEYLFLPPVLPRTGWMQGFGLGLLVASLVLRAWARLVMRGMYSGHLQIQAGHRLVQTGPYRWMRHPGYTAYLLMTLGLALGYSSLAGFAGIAVLLLPGLNYRMGVEERLLRQEFGVMYEEYAHRTRRLIPGIW